MIYSSINSKSIQRGAWLRTKKKKKKTQTIPKWSSIVSEEDIKLKGLQSSNRSRDQVPDLGKKFKFIRCDQVQNKPTNLGRKELTEI